MIDLGATWITVIIIDGLTGFELRRLELIMIGRRGFGSIGRGSIGFIGRKV